MRTRPVMTRGLFIGVAAMLLLAMNAGPAAARGAPDSFADLAEELLPSVVNISTVQNIRAEQRRMMPNVPPGSPLEEFFEEFFNRQAPRDGDDDEDEAPVRRAQSLGSGFIVSPDGFVVTNNHVIADADEITVRMSNGEDYEATIVGRDDKTDLALLKIEVDEVLPFVKFGDSDGARVGDWIMTIGNPYGLGGSVTAGIISAHHRDINSGPYDDFIQTDASINRGNSGGPMFNMDGEVIGVNTAIFSPTGGNIGIGFAIPSVQAERVIAQLKNFGRTKRGWLGVSIQPVTDDIAESMGLDEAIGALVSSVSPGSPAAAAGIEPSDIIVEWDGEEVEEMRELPRIVATTAIDKSVEVRVIRDGALITLQVTTGELDETEQVAEAEEPEEEEEERTEDLLGMELAALTGFLRERYDLPEELEGVVIVDLSRRSEAAQRGLRPGDVIMRVHKSDVAEIGDVSAAIDLATEDGREKVLVRLFRAGSYLHVALPVDNG